MRLLGIDLGDKRTGIASGDAETRQVFPITTLHIPAGEALLAKILTLATEHGADALILGLPLNMDGSMSPRAKATQVFGAELAAASGLPVHYQDERLTSFEAEQRLRDHDASSETADAHAAVIMIEEYLDSN